MKHAGRILVLFAVVALVTVGCAWFGGSQTLGLSSALVEFPSSISPSSATTRIVPRSASADVIASVQGIYTPVRDNYNAIAIDAIEFIGELLDEIDENIFADAGLMNYLEDNGSLVAGDATARWEITRSGNDYTVAGWTYYTDVWAQSIYVEFSVVGDRISGTVTLSEESAAADRTIYQAVFDSNDPALGLVTELSVVNLDSGNMDVNNIPTRLWIKAYDDGSSFQIAASVFYTAVNLEPGDLNDEFMDYINPTGAPTPEGVYMYRGSFETGGEERGKIDLALVPAAGYAGTDWFSLYSLGRIYEETVGAFVIADSGLVDAINLTGHVSPPITIGSSPVAVMTAIEQIYAADQTDASVANVVFSTQLTNPAYFAAGTGDTFVGTEDLLRPTWADTLPIFGLTIEQDQNTLPSMTVAFPSAMAAEPPAPTF